MSEKTGALRSERKAKRILHPRLEEMAEPLVADEFLHLFDPAQLDEGCPASFRFT